MQAVWEANTPDFRKRKRVVRACRACQKRKRKCYHTFAQDTAQPPGAFQGHHEPGTPLEAEDASRPKHVDSVRFVGDLNPESVLADLSERPKGSTRKSRVGVWIETSGDDVRVPPSSTERGDGIRHASSFSRPRSTTVAPQHPLLIRFLQETGAFIVLPTASQKPLVEIYVAHVHPFLPLIDVDWFLSNFERGKASNFLVLAICLTASKSSEAGPFLRWEADGLLVPARTFAKKLSEGLHFAINTGQETDALTKIQILGLLALHNDGPQGLETASMHLCQAIHHAHTLGLHIDSSRPVPQNGPTERMFWSLWCLDKFHACMAGRPVKIFDRDIGLARPTCTDDPSQALFQQHLALCELLANIIHYYRPTTDQDSTGWEEGFPTLEEITSNWSGVYKLDCDDAVELLYHIAAIIACRAGIVGTKSYNRREAAANQIELILRWNPSVHKAPLPIASYAASLSMTVAYRKLRDNQVTDSSPALVESLAYRCEMLERFKGRWWSAEAMARLGRKALRNIETLSNMQYLDQRSAGTAARPVHDADALNPLEMLSSVAESHAHGDLPNQRSQRFTAAAGPGDLLATEEPTMEIQDHPQDGSATTDMNERSDPFAGLDTAFGDFFDLSMPTTFFDPLFDDMEAFDFAELPT